MNDLPSALRELLDESFTFDSMYDIPPKLFSPLAAHRTCIFGAHRIRYQLHEAFPWLEEQPLIFVENGITYDARGRVLPPTEPVVGDPETFGGLGEQTQSVLGPASGDWILVVDDESDTFVGSRSAEDIVRLEWIFGRGNEEALTILYNWYVIRNANPTWLREWLPAALEHVLGPDVTAELLAREEGSWLAEL